MAKLKGTQIVGGKGGVGEREVDDFYATDPNTVKMFLDRWTADEVPLSGKVWECACGQGHLADVVKDCCPLCEVYSTDLVYRGYGKGGVDFLNVVDYPKDVDIIITNPPFKLLNEFIAKSLEVSQRYVIFFCKVQLLESAGRFKYLQGAGLKYVYLHINRQATWKGGVPVDVRGNKWSTTFLMGWYVWEKGYTGETILRFI